jgi:hypothetical protein
MGLDDAATSEMVKKTRVAWHILINDDITHSYTKAEIDKARACGIQAIAGYVFEDILSDANILGEESTHNNFWPGDGLTALNNIIDRRPDMLDQITVIRSDRKVITIEKFLNDIKKKNLSGVNYESYGSENKSPSARYMGALVADAHNILLNGGIFTYPPTKSHENGKLRLLYEANPMSLIFEQAGGAATNGLTRILDLQVKEIHQRTPLFIGSKDLVGAMTRYNDFYSSNN